MLKSILVGFDPRVPDHSPVQFGVLAARFTGAPLIIASAFEDAADAGEASDPVENLRRDLEAAGDHAEFRALTGGSPSEALHRAAEELRGRLLEVAAHHLEADLADLEMREDAIGVRGTAVEMDLPHAHLPAELATSR